MSPKKYSERKREEREAANSEAVGVILIIVSAFLLLCMITGGLILGDIGRAISNIFLGILGYFTFPLLLFTLILGIMKVQKRKVYVRAAIIVCIAVIVLTVVLIAQLGTSSKYLGEGFGAYISGVYSNKDTVGGVIFGVVAFGIHGIFKTVFSYIILSLALAVAVFFLFAYYLKLPFIGKADKKRDVKRSKASKFATSSAYAENGAFSAENRSGGLFVGTIVKPDVKYSHSGSFDDMPQEREREERLPAEPEERRDTGRIYSREEARKILFEENHEAYEQYLPKKAVAAPVIKHEEKQEIPEVPVPPQKYFEQNYIAGEIINGDELTEKMSKTGDSSAPDASQAEYSSAAGSNDGEVISYTKNSYTHASEEKLSPEEDFKPYFNPGPIINGDFFVSGEEAPVVEMFRDMPEIKDDLPGMQNMPEEVSDPDEASGTMHDEPEVYRAPKDEPEIQPDVRQEASLESSGYGNLVDELERESTDFAIDESAADDNASESEIYREVQAEPDVTIDVPDTEPLKAASEVEPLTEETESERQDAPENSEAVMSEKFEQSTSSFNISDEVEDLSERSYSNPNDTTGYYNQVQQPAPTVPAEKKASFESKVSEIDVKLNPSGKLNDQIDIDTFAHKVAEQKQISKPKPKKASKYVAPPVDLLETESTHPETGDDDTQSKILILEEALEELGVPAKVNGVTVGPAVTRYELDMPPGMSVRKIETLAPDIRYNLACKGQIRIESPIPGKRAVGIELPNDQIYTVALKDIINSSEFKASPSPLTIALGKDIQGKVMITRLEKMPHLLIAGTTGSGKSSCLNSLLISLLYKSSPQDVRIILIDPKQVEFTAYNGVPHMMIPNAITDVNQAINAFKWAYNEMERRYSLLSQHQVRDIQEYNSSTAVKEGAEPKMPFIVLIVDEFANLIMSSPANRKTLEDLIMAIASKARAAGIHLVIATQRPTVDVITGTIKANLPSRIAFSVSNAQNSRIILDNVGAEALLGRGDMLFAPLGESDETRIQGAYVENFEVRNIVNFVKENNAADYDSEFENAIIVKEPASGQEASGGDDENPYDKELIDVVRCVIKCGMASSSLIQRRFRFGWNKAARIMEQMEDLHFIGPQNNSKPREVYVTKEKFKEFFGEDYE